MKKMFLFSMLAALATLAGCFVMPHPYTGLAPGPWRAVLKLDPKPITPNPKGEPLPEKVNYEFEEVTEGELPFLFEVVYDSETDFHLDIINGEERIRVDDITFGRDIRTAKDTILIRFPVFDSYISAIVESNIMEGLWVVNYRENYSIPFVAYFGKDYRFSTLKKEPVADITGRWETTFEPEDEDPYKAVGEFTQSGNRLSGTFLTETGDYRYLEGTIQADKIYLSTFDGAHAFLFEGKILNDGSMIGSFRSGSHFRSVWEARRNSEFALSNPDSLTHLMPGVTDFNFSFPNPDGKMVSLSDPAYQGKVKLVQIMGTWCPNCRDETHFLKEYLDAHPDQDLAVIGLSFERYDDESRSMAAIRTFREKMALPYEVLLAGNYNNGDAAARLPMLDRVMSYPTLIFVDRNNRVRRIHTGFSGPATKEYESFKAGFQKTIEQLTGEQTTQ